MIRNVNGRLVLLIFIGVFIIFLSGYFIFKSLNSSYWKNKLTNLNKEQSLLMDKSLKGYPEMFIDLDRCRDMLDVKRDALLPRYREVLLKESKGTEITREDSLVERTYEDLKDTSSDIYWDTEPWWNSNNKSIKIRDYVFAEIKQKYFNKKSFENLVQELSHSAEIFTAEIYENTKEKYVNFYCPNISSTEITISNSRILCEEFAKCEISIFPPPKELGSSLYEEYLIALKDYNSWTQEIFNRCSLLKTVPID